MKEREQINQHIVQLNDTVRDWFEEKNPDERKEFHLRRHLWYKHVIKTTEDYLRAVEECNKRCGEKKKEIDKKKETIERKAKKQKHELQQKIKKWEKRNPILNQIQAEVHNALYKLDQELVDCKRACGKELFEIEEKMLTVLFFYDTVYGVMLPSPFELEVDAGYFSRDGNHVTKEGWQYRPPEPKYIDGTAEYEDPEDDPNYDSMSEDPEVDPHLLLLEMAPNYPDIMFHAENEESFKSEAALFNLACELRRELDVEKTSLSYAVSQQEKEESQSNGTKAFCFGDRFSTKPIPVEFYGDVAQHMEDYENACRELGLGEGELSDNESLEQRTERRSKLVKQMSDKILQYPVSTMLYPAVLTLGCLHILQGETSEEESGQNNGKTKKEEQKLQNEIDPYLKLYTLLKENDTYIGKNKKNKFGDDTRLAIEQLYWDVRASCYQILGDFSSVNPLNDKLVQIEKYLRKDPQAKYRGIGIPVIDRAIILEKLSETKTAQVYQRLNKMTPEELKKALEWEFNKMIDNNGLYQEIRKWEEAGEKEFVAFRKLVDATAFLCNTRQISYFTSYKTSKEAETALNDLTKMWVENRPDVITKTEKEGIVTLQIGNYSGASPALDELIREYYQIVIDQPPLNDFNWLRYYLFCDQMKINRKDLSDLLFYKIMKIPLLDKWMLEDTYIHFVHDRIQHITALNKYEIEKNFSANPNLITAKISTMKKWNKLFLEEFTHDIILPFLEKKEHFTLDGFSQYVDSLFSKKKEYPVYSKLPRTIKNQICNSLFSTAIMEVETYTKEKLLAYLNAIVQLDIDYWCV